MEKRNLGNVLSAEQGGEVVEEEPPSDKKAEATEDPPVGKKDETPEGPPAKKKPENIFPTKKSAAQLLQEHSDKRGVDVAYEWDTVGGSSQLRFICRVQVGDEVFTGAGISKKAAKQSAAGAALEVLDLPVESAPAEAPRAHAFTPEGDNPISVLNQLTSRKKIPTPEYELVAEQVMANRTQFTMTCRVGKVMEKGSGPCKKVAKQDAALKVLEKLKQEEKQRGEPRTGQANHAGPSTHFSEQRREMDDSRACASPYNKRAWAFSEHHRGPGSPTFSSTLDPLSEVFTSTGSIKPLTEFRRDHSAEEMPRAPGCDVQGFLNTSITRSPMGNQRCYSTQELPREPMDRAQYPLVHGSLNSGMDRSLLAHQQRGVPQELNTAPIDYAQFHLAWPPPNAGTMRPLVLQDHSLREKRNDSVDNAMEPLFRRALNSATVGPLLGHPQHPSSQNVNRPPGDYSHYPLTQQSVNSGLSRPFQTHPQGTNVQELHPAPKDNTQFQLARASLNPGTIVPPMEHRGNPSAQELEFVSKNNTQYPWLQTPASTGMFRPAREHHQQISAQQLSTEVKENAEYTATPLKLTSTVNQTTAQQRCTGSQELNTTHGHNTGYPGAFINPAMMKHLHEHQQDPSTRELGHNVGYTCSSPNPDMIKPHQGQPQDPTSQQSHKTQENDAQCMRSLASQNTAAGMPSLEPQVGFKPLELNSAQRTNMGLTSILGPPLKHQQKSSVEQVATHPENNANFPLASPSSKSINPLLGLWQGAQALGFNMK
ncbi:hypothetical protein NDU88_001160 [Pleurodeles waltl]|uniref:DRBM domain-containing protein n=1 Tax=Pleurodeles waltl TaxID=8319 RepID=A0AAV7LXT3_PLEWA|nr:hypothetical protein NDU88_001160 [Pleurodeles waltl]